MIQIKDFGEVRQFRLARSFRGRPWYFTSAYLVDGLLIDTGCAHTAEELTGALDGVSLCRIVNTHSHEDHIGANAVLQQRFGLEALVHPAGLPVLEAPKERQPLRPYQKLMWGYPSPSKGRPLGQTVETDRFSFRVIHTPGHSPDHVCLYEPDQGWLFSGDAFVGGRDRALRADYHIWRIISSLRRLSELDVGLIFTAGGSVKEDGRSALKEKVEYLEKVGRRVLDLADQGLNFSRIRRKVFGPELPIYYITQGHFSGKNLVRSFIQDRPTDKEP